MKTLIQLLVKKKKSRTKKNIRMMNSQRSDAEKAKWIQEGKKIGINVVINNSLKLQIWYLHTYKIKSYCLKRKKDAENINPRVSKTSNNRTMILSKCTECGIKTSRFIKNQEAKDLLSNLGIRTSLSKVPILGDILF